MKKNVLKKTVCQICVITLNKEMKKKNLTQHQNYINAKSKTADNSDEKSDKRVGSESTNKIKKRAEENKANNSPNKIESKD